jgi:sugar O-acyltransferase (sialic acid O-acetyltransferase NeuD family)
MTQMNIVFIGAANPETIRMIQAVRRVHGEFRAVGFVDNDPAKQGKDFFGLPILGTVAQIRNMDTGQLLFVNLITGSTLARFEVTRDAVREGAKFTNFIHPTVDLTMTRLGLGNYLQEGVILQAGVEVGDNSSIHMGAVIGHESRIGSSVFIAHAVSVSGCCSIGDGCFIGTNATILPRIQVGKWSTIGAGAVVTKNVPDYAVVAGNPARCIKSNPVIYAHGEALNAH